MNTGWREIDNHCCYSLVKVAFAPVWACKNNRWIWRHNASTLHSRDFTDRAVMTSQCQVRKDHSWRKWQNEQSIVLAGLWARPRHKILCNKYDYVWVTMNTNFFVTREAIQQWFAESPHSWQKIGSNHSDPYIILYLFCTELAIS